MSYDGYFKYDARVAADYDCDREREEHWIAERDFVAAYSRSHRLGRVLDVPVGTGRLLDQLTTADEIVGVDVSADMLAVAGGRPLPAGLPRPALIRGDALALPFADRHFDTAICFRLAHLLPTPLVPKLIAELARVCRGRILLQAYVPIAKRSGLGAVFRRALRAVLPRERRPWTHIQSFGHPETLFEQAAGEAGLAVMQRQHLADYGPYSVDVLELAHRSGES